MLNSIDFRRYQPNERPIKCSAKIEGALPSLVEQFMASGGVVESIPYGMMCQDKLATKFSVGNTGEDMKVSKTTLQQEARAREARFNQQGVK